MDRFQQLLHALNECTNLIALGVMIVGAILVLKGHTEMGLITGAFALINASSKKNQEKQ